MLGLIESFKDKKFLSLWLASIFGAVSVLPYVTAIEGGVVVTPVLVFGVAVQAALFYALIVFFGLKVSEKLNFKLLSSWRDFLIPSVVSGLCVGLLIKFSDRFLFAAHSMLLHQQVGDVASWKLLLASFYGAINEEVLDRLLIVPLFALILKRVSKIKTSHCIIISIVLSALLFGCGHLPMLYKILGDPTIWDCLRVILLNSFAGVVFGLLYWRYGLISAMLSHFIADLVVHLL